MSASSKNLFISYASTNKTRVRAKIVIPCTQMGHKPWFDHWLIPGQNWQRQLEDHIQACDVFIYVITPPAIKSYWCRWEYNTAIKYQKPIIPLYLKKTEIPAEIKLLQYIDFSGDFLERPTAELQAALLDARFDPTAEPLPLDDHTLRGLPNGAFEGILVFGTVVLLLVLVLGVFMSRLLVSGDETIFVATPESFTSIPSLTQTPFEIASATVEKVITPTPTLTQTATDTATNRPTNTATLTPTDTTTASLTRTPTKTNSPTQTVTQTASPTNTPSPEIIFTATPTPRTTLSPTPDSRALAERGVTRNAEWLPYKEVIDGVEMVLVPKGCFQMGSDADPDEQPIHEVCFERPFWLDLYEVTQAQFEQFDGEKANIYFYLGATLPTENITWWEALIYCENRGGRLPTEAEWEFAARGPDSWLYPWGNDFIGDYVAFAGNATKTVSVGSHSRGMSWTGAMDMSGNVWEWVSSLYKPYPFLLEDGRQQEGNQFGVRVVRGGSFNNEELNLRTADRLWFDADNMSGLVGVRCARDYE